MPRYFFDVHDGKSIEDIEGLDLPDLEAAKKEALRYASALLADDGRLFWSKGDWHMQVADEAGLILLRIDLAATVTPVV